MENSPITQTTPEPTLLSWGGWPLEKNSPPPLATLRSYRANRATQTLLLFSNPLILLRCVTEIKLFKTCIDLETDIRIGISSTLHIELKVEWNF